MLKTRVNGTVRPEMDAGLRRGIAAAAVLLIVCVLAVGVVSADTVTVSNFDELQNNISTFGDRTIIVSASFPITSQLTIASGNITLTTNNADRTLSRDGFTGNLFRVNSGGKLTITGFGTSNLTLDGMQISSANSLVYVSGGSFTLADGGILANNTASSDGGGVYMDGGTFTMSGGILTNNTANSDALSSGGGVYMDGGTFEMSGNAVISKNQAPNGGGVYVDNSGTFTMSGGILTNNTANINNRGSGGGVYVDGGTFTMNNGIIFDNEAYSYGGGVWVYDGTFTMNDGIIFDNEAYTYGGGVAVNRDGTFTMSDGEISGNKASSTSSSAGGGGVYVNGDGTFTMSDGEISDNYAGNRGGGVYNSGTFNILDNGSVDGVYLPSGMVITVTGNLTGTDPQVTGINLENKIDSTTVVKFSNDVSGANYLNRFTLDTSVTDFVLLYQDSSNTILLKTPPTYTVTFETNGGEPQPENLSVSYGAKLTKPGTLTKTGYTFNGWYKEEACTNLWDFDNDTVTENITLYANWTTNMYTVQFDAQGGSAVANQTVPYDGTVTEPTPAPVLAGHTLEGWYKEEACTNLWDFDNDTVTENITLYANWTTNMYTVQFDAQGGSAVANQTVPYDGTVTEPTPAPVLAGHTLEGWYKEEACTNLWDFDNDTVTENITLYANWTTNMYTVQFDAQGGSAVANQTVPYDGTVTEPTPAPVLAGHTLEGWYKEEACTNLWNFTTDTVTSDMTLYANWTLNTYTVSFNTQGGSTVPAQTVSHGEMVNKPADPTKTGFTFTNWYNESACLNLWDFTTPVTSDITLYAGWKEDEPGPGPEPTPVPPSGSSGDGNMENAYRVLFNDGATTLSVVTDLSAGDKLTKPEDPVKDGYTFAGWHKDSACTQAWDFNDGITGDMTLYAKWTAIEATPTATATATATAVTTPQPTATQTTAAATSVPQATTAAAVSPTLVQTPAPVAGALLGLLAAGLLLRRRLQ